MPQAAHPRIQSFDIAPPLRIVLLACASTLLALACFAIARAALGLAPATAHVRSVALLVHLSTVLPAIPLGMYIFLTRKGGPRHRLLGRIWLGLMGTTAIATLFLRNVADGNFSWLHLFSALTLVGIPRAILTAKRGQIAKHKAGLLQMFTGALLIAGAASFIPGRTMGTWAFG